MTLHRPARSILCSCGHRGSLAVAIGVALGLAFAGCDWACGRAHDATEKVGEKLVSVELEQKLGAQMAESFRGEVPLHRDPVVQNYVDTIGRQLVSSATDIPDGMNFDFQVIDAPGVVNAMAMPGGYIYVHSGLLEAVDTEAELAGVLAHEIAHVTERHVVAQLLTALGIQTVRALAQGEEGGVLGDLVAEFATRGALGAYSRTAEREADEIGVRTLARAGWDPRGYVGFFAKLASASGRPGPLTRFIQSHPDPAERAERARRLIDELELNSKQRDTGELKRIRARLGR